MTHHAVRGRWEAYCDAHGVDPACDDASVFGAFLVWNDTMLTMAALAIPHAFGPRPAPSMRGALIDHAAYDAWLTAYVDALRPPTQTKLIWSHAEE